MGMRIFVAVPLPAEAKDIVRQAAEELKHSVHFQKWVHPEDYHITLKFLGETDAATIERLTDILRQVASEAEEMKLEARGIGEFGPPRKPSILWVGVGGDTELLRKLQQSVELAAKECGFPAEDKPYRPHITIARRYAGDTYWKPEVVPKLSWTAQELVLYESRLGAVPMYRALSSFALQPERARS